MKLTIFMTIFFVLVSKSFAQGVDLDLPQSAPKFKGVKNSSFEWNNVDLKDLLSFKKWKENTDEKAIYPDWETIVKERTHKELAGRFFQCVGSCRVDRAESFFNPKFRSSLYEGDEIQTLSDSYAWIFLVDGTMLRLSPESSITINEINIGIKENFFNVRINSGNVLWLSRTNKKYIEVNEKETDLLFYPLSLHDAQPDADTFNYREDRLFRFLDVPQTHLYHFRKLNRMIEETNEWAKNKKTYAFIVLPNLTVMGYNPQVEFISLMGNQSYVKAKLADDLGIDGELENELRYQLRGYDSKEFTKLNPGVWMEIDSKGKSIKEAAEVSRFAVGEFLTKRLPGIMIARELLMRDYSKVCFQESYDKRKLAIEDGYRLWGSMTPEENKKDDLYLRLEFLKEYFRRIETTNLLVTERFGEKLKSRGESIKVMEYGPYFYQLALEQYLSYVEYSDDNEIGERLNSTQKKLWKIMHGIK